MVTIHENEVTPSSLIDDSPIQSSLQQFDRAVPDIETAVPTESSGA